MLACKVAVALQRVALSALTHLSIAYDGIRHLSTYSRGFIRSAADFQARLLWGYVTACDTCEPIYVTSSESAGPEGPHPVQVRDRVRIRSEIENQPVRTTMVC